MRRFSRPASDDLIINFFTSFGYFDDPADDLRVLELVRENLRPSGGVRTGNGEQGAPRSRVSGNEAEAATKRSCSVRATRNRGRLDASAQSLDADPNG